MRKDICLPLLALAGGGGGFALRYWQLNTAFDRETMLFVPGSAATYALLALLAAVAVLLALLVWGGTAPQDYPQAYYCPSSLYMTLMTAGCFLLFGSAGLGVLEFRDQLALWSSGVGYPFPAMALLSAVLCVPAGAAALLLGKGNYRGTLPGYHPILTCLLAYGVLPWIVALYQANSRQPEIMLFGITVLGTVCAGLGFYAAACFAFGRPRMRMGLFFSLMAVVLLLTSLADRPGRFTAVMSIACVLLMLAQSMALLRNSFGPPWPEAEVQEEESREEE